ESAVEEQTERRTARSRAAVDTVDGGDPAAPTRDARTVPSGAIREVARGAPHSQRRRRAGSWPGERAAPPRCAPRAPGSPPRTRVAPARTAGWRGPRRVPPRKSPGLRAQRARRCPDGLRYASLPTRSRRVLPRPARFDRLVP